MSRQANGQQLSAVLQRLLAGRPIDSHSIVCHDVESGNRGLQQFRVRGLAKVRTVSLWYALTFNWMRMWQLGVL